MGEKKWKTKNLNLKIRWSGWNRGQFKFPKKLENLALKDVLNSEKSGDQATSHFKSDEDLKFRM